MAEPGEKRKRCILLAEDDVGLLALFKNTLTKEGYEVIAAENGQAALLLSRNHRGTIELLVTDIEMPKLDGFDLQEQLRREQPNVKLLVISGALDSSIEGVDFHLLRKPFHQVELANKVRQILG